MSEYVSGSPAAEGYSEQPGIAEALLRRAYRMHVARQMIGRVAVEFDDVLHGVLSALDAMHLQLGQRNGEDLGPLIDTTATSLHRAALLSRRLMKFARNPAFKREPVDVNAVVTSMIVLVRSMLGFQVDLEIRLGQNLPNAYCDANELEAILFNLAIDARNSIVGRGRLVLETSSATVYRGIIHPIERSFVQICMADTGQFAQTTAEPDRCAARWTVPELACSPTERTSVIMAKRFAASLNGHFDVDSHPEAGTAVTMLLPALSEREGHFNPNMLTFAALHEMPYPENMRIQR